MNQNEKEPNGPSQPAAARVGKYLMLDMLGEGAFGKVRLAVDETNGHQYAIKIMEKSHIKANELTLQVRREIAVMKAMRHPNIVNLHEVLTSSKNLYMVMDLVTGGELFDAVAEAGKLPESRARLYFQQLVDGIHYCHRRRVYHRDLKPENLLLSGDKQIIKITDFGLSSIKASNASDELLHTIMGSPHYIAPEIITSAAQGYDGCKVDVWASGVILFGMLAGFLPFDEVHMGELYRSIVHKQVSYPPHFSYDVIKLLRAMLQKDPIKRPTMEQVKQFTWFKINYRPALSEDGNQIESLSPVQVPTKKGKLKTRVKKSSNARGNNKKKNNNSGNTPIQENDKQTTTSTTSISTSSDHHTQGNQPSSSSSPPTQLQKQQQTDVIVNSSTHTMTTISVPSSTVVATNASRTSFADSDTSDQREVVIETETDHQHPKQQRTSLSTSSSSTNGLEQGIKINGNVTGFQVNATDMNNAFEVVDTPMPINHLTVEQQMKATPFSNNVTASSSDSHYTQQTQSQPQQKNHHHHYHHHSRPFSILSSSSKKRGGGGWIGHQSGDHNATSTGNSHQFRHDFPSSSSGFRDGVKKVLESGFEAIVSSTKASKAKAHADVHKLSLHTLFSSQHPADIPLHTGQENSDGQEHQQQLQNNAWKHDGSQPDINIHCGQQENGSGSNSRDRNDRVMPQQTLQKRGYDHAWSQEEKANHMPFISPISTKGENQNVHHVFDPTPDIQEKQQYRDQRVYPHPLESPSSMTSMASPSTTHPPLQPESPSSTQENEPLNSPSANINDKHTTKKVGVLGEQEVDAMTAMDNAMLTESSPMTAKSDGNGSNVGIFKPAKSLFKPLAKTLLEEEETMITYADLYGVNEQHQLQQQKEENAIVSNEWGLDTGEVFADVEPEGESMRWVHPDALQKRRTGAAKFMNDLRRALSGNGSDAGGGGDNDQVEEKEEQKKTIFAALNSDLVHKLTTSGQQKNQ